MDHHFEFLLFSTDPSFITRAVAGGVDGVIVDWENMGKKYRQKDADTQINYDTFEDLVRVRQCTHSTLICRINQFSPGTEDEVIKAIAGGADEILLPMVRTAAEVEDVLGIINGRCRLGILIETIDAVKRSLELAALPLSRVYVGLNDLGIERATPNIFTALIDGTVEAVRPHFTGKFGFGGLTLPELGAPIPCRLLMGEMMRMRCTFTFLRRSFIAHTAGKDLSVEIPRIRGGLQAAQMRSAAEIEHDRNELSSSVSSWGSPRADIDD